MHPTASFLVVSGISAISASVAVLVAIGGVVAAWREPGGGRRFASGVGIWFAATAAIGASGLLHQWGLRPPPFMLLAVASLVGAGVLARSSLGAKMATRLPLVALVGFQVFRLPLELVMHRAATEGTMPPQMTYTGCNFDILTGLSAGILALGLWRGAVPRVLLYAWNLVGLGLLVTIVGIAVASLPMFAAFGPDRLNTWIGWFPFMWMITINVPAALLGHLVLFRRLAAVAR